MTVPVEFFDTIWGPLGHASDLRGEIRAFPGAKQSFLRTPDDAAFIAEEYVQTHDVYFGVLRRRGSVGTAEATVPATHVLWADFDAKNFAGRKTGPGSAFAELANMRLTPHIIVDSGHGFHAYWLLDKEYEFTQAQIVMKGIERAHHSDHCSDAARILRVPGTFNFKDDIPLPVRIVRFDTFIHPYSLDAFQDYVYGPPAKRSLVGYTGTAWKPSDEDAPKFDEGGRNNNLARLAGIMLSKGMSHEDIMVALSWENEMRCDPPLMPSEVRAVAQSVERYR